MKRRIHGFELRRETEIRELKTLARLYGHAKTGAELLSLSNDDENKVFGITFRTPPAGSTGVAHILEHSVLCGSRKYPVKEPFVELLKGSLQTFLNAFTYPDRTCYPVASQNIQDFYNLIDVYLDAVFHPRLTPWVFQQEGWHYDLEAADRPLTYRGVVFSEMKGAYSSPDTLLSEYSLRSLFPGHPYGVDAGGDPKEIPNLTFDQFKAFHRTFYHPSNARIYFCGDDPPEERLRLVNGYLEEFERIRVDSEIPPMSRFDRPQRMEHPFMVGEGDSPRGMVTVNWLLTENAHVESHFAFLLLEYMLLGMPGSPLRKALIDSGLGEDLAGDGLGTELREITFSTGLKGIDVKDAERIEALITDTLRALVEKGLDPLTVEAALNTLEFRLRENNTGQFPRGLVLMLRALSAWLYGRDPLSLLAFEAPMDAIKSYVKAGRGYFEQMVARHLLNNPHRTVLTFRPDPAMREREEAREQARLTEARSGMTPDERERIAANTRELRRIQETPDPPEALAAIPCLELSDLDKENRPIPLDVGTLCGTRFLVHDLFTNGIVYLDIGFNLHVLPEDHLPYIPLLGRALVEMGTKREDFVSFTRRISRKTGGLTPELFTSEVLEGGKSAVWLFLRGKAMVHQSADLMEILRDMLTEVRLDDRERFRQMLLEAKARAERRLVPLGHQVVNLRLRAHYGEAHWAAEQMGGITHLFFLRNLVRTVEEDWPRVLHTLEQVRRSLVNRQTMIVNATLDGKDRSGLEARLKALLAALPEFRVNDPPWDKKTPSPRFEGMTLPSQVNYVGKGANLYDLGYRFHGSALVVTRYLRNAWLWDRIRLRGGAYGAFCLFDRPSGVLTFLSYRDPNLMETLEVFDQAAGFLEGGDLGEEELKKSIIGAVGDLDAHLLPDAKGYASMLRELTGHSDEIRQRMRDEVLGTRPSHFKAFAEILRGVQQRGIVKVLGSPAALERVSAERPGWMERLEVL